MFGSPNEDEESARTLPQFKNGSFEEEEFTEDGIQRTIHIQTKTYEHETELDKAKAFRYRYVTVQVTRLMVGVTLWSMFMVSAHYGALIALPPPVLGFFLSEVILAVVAMAWSIVRPPGGSPK